MNTLRKLVICGTVLLSAVSSFSQSVAERWSEARADAWYKEQGWLTGVNYIPSDAINYTAMWDKTSFNPELIDRELALAEGLGFNFVRVVLQYAIYADDPKYFLKTFGKFLKICGKHHIKVMPTFFDDCAFWTSTDPKIGKQDEPLIGWYAWEWSPSPGHTLVRDVSKHGLLEKYVKDVLKKFRKDKRVAVWDLYNEPSNSELGEASLPLLKSVFRWACEINPCQPLTVGFYYDNKDLNSIILDNSDVISFHCYDPKAKMEEQIKQWKQYNRPVICTEWMNRPGKSTVEEIMPLLKAENVGSLLWGLVNGKTQTDLPWGHRPEKLPYTGPWQHDLFRNDFTPYDAKEIELIKSTNFRKR